MASAKWRLVTACRCCRQCRWQGEVTSDNRPQMLMAVANLRRCRCTRMDKATGRVAGREEEEEEGKKQGEWDWDVAGATQEANWGLLQLPFSLQAKWGCLLSAHCPHANPWPAVVPTPLPLPYYTWVLTAHMGPDGGTVYPSEAGLS